LAFGGLAAGAFSGFAHFAFFGGTRRGFLGRPFFFFYALGPVFGFYGWRFAGEPFCPAQVPFFLVEFDRGAGARPVG
jgi:hypothetical protein